MKAVSPNKRESLSKKLRFEVFKRDNFQCQYCGKSPPVVILEVDHVVPVSAAGKNTIDNLLCSCFDCNRGKGATPLDVVPLQVVAKAAMEEEAESQLKAYQEILRSKRLRLEEEAWEVAEIYSPGCSASGFNKAKLKSISLFIDRLGLHEVIHAMDIAVFKRIGNAETFQYFCGICWGKIKGCQNG
jgi:hypothetical protein